MGKPVIIIDAPPLTDEGVLHMRFFLKEILHAFDTCYSDQITRRSLHRMMQYSSQYSDEDESSFDQN